MRLSLGRSSKRPVILSELVTQTKLVGAGAPKSGFTFIGQDPTPDLPHLNGALGPLPVLAKSAAGIGFVNWQADADRVVRRVPLLIDVNGQIQPSFAVECLRVAQGASTYLIKSADAGGSSLGQGAGVAAIKVGDLVASTEPAGDIRAYFAASDPSLSTAAWKLFQPGPDLADLEGKIVVVGASAALLSDVVATPLNRVNAGRRSASATDRADRRRRRAVASRLGAGRRSGGLDPAVAGAGRRDAAAVDAVERRPRRAGGRFDGGRLLAGVHP